MYVAVSSYQRILQLLKRHLFSSLCPHRASLAFYKNHAQETLDII